MAIAIDCPKCGKHLTVASELAGRRGKCPQCQVTLEIPRAAAPAAGMARARTLSEQDITFAGEIVRPKVSVPRKLGALIVAAILLLMPVFYTAVIGAVVFGMWWLATGSVGQRLPPAAFWLVQVVLGVVLLCLIKPLVEPQRRAVESYPLDLSNEDALRGLIEKTCAQIGAPAPRSVLLECSTRAAVSGRGGGQLTLGLPLVACLNVDQLVGVIAGQMALVRRGCGCGVTNLIRGINGWLWRSVYGKSRFDQWLALVAERPHFHLAKLLLPLAACKFAAQAVLFVPMFIANTIGAAVVRGAERDADLAAARLIGLRSLGGLLERQELIEFTWDGVVAELDFLHREQALPDCLPDQLAVRMLDMTPELRAALRETVTKPEEKPFDTRSSSPDRLAAIAGEPAQGVFQCGASAKGLLKDYDKYARKMTWDFYSARFGAQLLKTGLKPVAAP